MKLPDFFEHTIKRGKLWLVRYRLAKGWSTVLRISKKEFFQFAKEAYKWAITEHRADRVICTLRSNGSYTEVINCFSGTEQDEVMFFAWVLDARLRNATVFSFPRKYDEDTCPLNEWHQLILSFENLPDPE